MKTTGTVTVTKMEWVKDDNGKHVYDTPALDKWKAKLRRQTERQNAKIVKAQAEGRLLDYTLANVEQVVEFMVKMYGHQFRAMVPGKVTVTTY